MIHPTAIIDPKADIDSSVNVGPYTIINRDVTIGAGTEVGSHVVIDPYVTIGPNCKIYQYAAIGAVPQSLKFQGEVTYVKINQGTIVREFVTIHRGTEGGGGITEVGEENYLMAYSHVAHDCITGKRVIMANTSTLAGHVTIGNYANIGGLVAVHQYVRIGDHAFVGGKSAVVKDIPPYVIAAGDRAKLHGLNTVGLKRFGMTDAVLSALKKTYRIIFRIGLTRNEAIERVIAEIDQIPEVRNFIQFIQNSKRGVTR